jgi:hypothetical protein
MLLIELCEATVAKYMVRYRKPPSQTWRTLLANHMKDMVSSLLRLLRGSGRVLSLLFVFVIVRLENHVRLLNQRITDQTCYNVTRVKRNMCTGTGISCDCTVVANHSKDRAGSCARRSSGMVGCRPRQVNEWGRPVQTWRCGTKSLS